MVIRLLEQQLDYMLVNAKWLRATSLYTLCWQFSLNNLEEATVPAA
jgi:hypothetical protein